jgi:hypothetical protein
VREEAKEATDCEALDARPRREQVIWVRSDLRGIVMSAKKSARLACATLVVGLVALLAVPSLASAAGPIWRVDALSNTTVAAGDTLTYLVQATNVGTDPTSGPYAVTINLPTGLTGVDAGNADTFGDPSQWTCTAGDGSSPVLGATIIRCTASGVLGRGSGPLSSQFIVDLAADASASGVLTTTVDLSGGGVASDASTSVSTTVRPQPPGFGVAAFDAQVAADGSGSAFTQAGGHPFAASTSIDFNTLTNPNPFIGPLWPAEPTKDVFVDLPTGFVAYPPAAAKCTAADLRGVLGGFTPVPLCSSSSQVGTALVRLNAISASNVFGPVPLYNMVAPPGVPARLGFNLSGSIVTIDATVRNGSDFGVGAAVLNVPEALPIASTTITLWGSPADSSHDTERGCAGEHEPFDGFGDAGPVCPSSAPVKAFLRNPTSCDPPTPGEDGLTTTAHIDSWDNPGRVNLDGTPDLTDARWKSASSVSHLPPGYPAPQSQWGAHQLPTGCDQVPFNPTLSLTPMAPSRTGFPSGVSVDLSVPQSDDPEAVGEADLKKAVVKLPEGVRVSLASAGGLGACSPSQIALHSSAEPTCPDNSKIGTLSVTTPLLDQPLSGSVYLATPHDNPFNSLLAIYFVIKGPGVVIKLPGEVESDPSTGQITTTFDNQPQLPFTNLHLEFFSGPHAALVTPNECGEYTTHATLTSWSGKTVTSDSSFTLDANSDGTPCAPHGFSPAVNAWTDNPIAGHESQFTLWLTRTDRDQSVSTLAFDTPGGMLARIANAVLCPDAVANAGACQGGSKIGDVTVGAGAGTDPFFITSGRAYITGPYKGAPYGLSIVVPAVAGPFDLGNVVVRSAIYVNRQTAALKIVSDPLPTIIQGIPLGDVRDIRVFVNRSHFFLNPTSCAEKHILGTIKSTQGAIAHTSTRFQVGECANLKLAPKLTLTVGAKRHTRAGTSTPLTTTLTQTPGQTNLRSVSVALPGTLNALLPVIRRACKLAEFQAGHCGSQSRVGSAVAVTPLLRDPLRGSAYFVKNPKRILPDLMIALRGQVDLDLTGKVSIPGGKRLATRFDTIPDAPITKFTLRIVSGKNGPVGIATNLCSRKGRNTPAAIGFRGQNGRVLRVSQRIIVKGCPKR